jgi:hypothetical protein
MNIPVVIHALLRPVKHECHLFLSPPEEGLSSNPTALVMPAEGFSHPLDVTAQRKSLHVAGTILPTPAVWIH